MTIRRARASDIPAIRQGFQTVANPPNVEDRQIEQIIEDGDNSIFVDTVERILCQISAMPDSVDLSVVWLVPPRKPILQRGRVLKASAEDALARFPERADWRIWAVFPWEADGGERPVREWKAALRDGPTIRRLGANERYGPEGDWIIFWTLEAFVLKLREVLP